MGYGYTYMVPCHGSLVFEGYRGELDGVESVLKCNILVHIARPIGIRTGSALRPIAKKGVLRIIHALS